MRLPGVWHHRCRIPRRAPAVDRWPLLASSYPIGYSPAVFLLSQTPEFVAWLDGLADRRAQLRIAARLRQVETGNLGDWQPVQGVVSELRVHFGPGYRLYFTRRGAVVVVLLNGGDKSTQRRDIRRALQLAAAIGDEP